MNITSKSRYALKIMMDLAEQEEGGSALTHRVDVAARQGIPLEYMDQILGRLREAGLVVSTRGRRGGYQLGRKADGVSILEIFRSVEDAWLPVACLEEHGGGRVAAHVCASESICSTRDTWSMISGAISTSLSGILLSDVLARKTAGPLSILPVDAARAPGGGAVTVDSALPAVPAAPAVPVVQECRAPRRRPAGPVQLPLQGTKTP